MLCWRLPERIQYLHEQVGQTGLYHSGVVQYGMPYKANAGSFQAGHKPWHAGTKKWENCIDCGKQIARAGRCRPCYYLTLKGTQPPHYSGSDNPNWIGGRIVNVHGYVLLRVKNTYVYEHRWVVEQAIGRPLLPNEHVHHKNGDKADNRYPENLEVLIGQEHNRKETTERWQKGAFRRKTLPLSEAQIQALAAGRAKRDANVAARRANPSTDPKYFQDTQLDQ